MKLTMNIQPGAKVHALRGIGWPNVVPVTLCGKSTRPWWISSAGYREDVTCGSCSRMLNAGVTP